ncbi:MAG: hypothetical protein JRL30_04445 [Deltaproteobacteria bacterium]|nr:hypothetical protein [Deltaproteobacteria bacterium]
MIRRRIKLIAPVMLLLGLYGCGLVGPASLKEGRSRYNQVIAYTSSEQMLINLVKLRYRDSPTFLQVSSISTNMQWGASASTQIPIGDSVYSAGNIVPFGAGIKYGENPTVTYTPLAGEAFVRQMLTPIPLQTLILLFQAGWPIDTVFRLVVQEVNDLENASPASGPTPEREPIFRNFLEAAWLFRDLQRRRVVEWGIGGKEKGMGIMYIHPHLSKDEQRGVARLKELLRLRETQGGMEQYEVGYGVCYETSTRLNVVTRSMNDILFYIAQAVEVPPCHVKKKLVTTTLRPDGTTFDWSELHREQIRIRWSESRPEDAYISVHHRGFWFYIKDSDLDSKSTFLLLQMLGDLQAGTTPSTAPVLTLPVAR